MSAATEQQRWLGGRGEGNGLFQELQFEADVENLAEMLDLEEIAEGGGSVGPERDFDSLFDIYFREDDPPLESLDINFFEPQVVPNFTCFGEEAAAATTKKESPPLGTGAADSGLGVSTVLTMKKTEDKEDEPSRVPDSLRVGEPALANSAPAILKARRAMPRALSRRSFGKPVAKPAGRSRAARGDGVKVHTLPIADERVLHQFTVPRMPHCPHNCQGTCQLGVYQNTVNSTAPDGSTGKCLFFGHWCNFCSSWHQIEDHGHSNVYGKFRFNANAGFMDVAGLEKVVRQKSSRFPRSWFGNPRCKFGNLEEKPRAKKMKKLPSRDFM